MKRVIALLLVLLVIFSLTGCNQQVFDFNYKFDKAYVIIGNDVKEVDIQSWRDYENSDMMQITTVDGDVYLTHSTNIILVG